LDELSGNEKAISACKVSVMKNKAKTILCAVIPAIVALGIFGLMLAPSAPASNQGDTGDNVVGGFVFLFFICFIALLVLRTYKSRWVRAKAEMIQLRNRNQQLVAERDEDVMVGHHVCCPHCATSFNFIGRGSQMPTGLQHCLTCGKQFFTSHGYTYPLICGS
jgi:hypothetical protein